MSFLLHRFSTYCLQGTMCSREPFLKQQNKQLVLLQSAAFCLGLKIIVIIVFNAAWIKIMETFPPFLVCSTAVLQLFLLYFRDFFKDGPSTSKIHKSQSHHSPKTLKRTALAVSIVLQQRPCDFCATIPSA